MGISLEEVFMTIFIIAALVWLQVAFLYDYQLTYPIYISIGCALMAFVIYLYKTIKGFKKGK